MTDKSEMAAWNLDCCLFWPSIPGISSEGGTNLRTSMVQTNPSLTSSYTYDSQGRLKTYTPPVGLNSGYYVEYNYNNAGQKTEVKITDGSSTPYDVTYDYYANGWLKDVKSGTSTIASYGYDAIGNRLTQTNGNSTSTAYAYDTTDPRYPLNSITHASGSTTLATIGYPTRDNMGDPLSMTDWTGTWNYTYDANNRLDSATPPNPVPDQPAGGNYGYDWVGNRLNPPTGDNAMVYNAADQLIRWPGMHGNATTPGYVYDLAGNLTTVKDTAGNILSSYTYTLDGLMASATYKKYNWTSFVDTTLTNAWDADKNRVSFTAGGTTHTFVYDTTAGIPAVIKEDGIYYIREPGGELIARVSGSNINYYHFDQLGSTRLLTNSSGSITDEYAYDAYGSLIAHQRLGWVDQPYKYVGKYGYYTHWQEPEFGLLQLGVRLYDPEVGSFTQQDRMKDGINWYAYADNNPIVIIDPTGNACYKCWRRMYVGPISGLWHAFIWCDNNGNGYDDSDGVIGMTGKGTGGKCLDTDRKYFRPKDAKDGKNKDLNCTPVANKLAPCINRRIAADLGKKCFGDYNIAFNNCQEYASDVISDCADEVLKEFKNRF